MYRSILFNVLYSTRTALHIRKISIRYAFSVRQLKHIRRGINYRTSSRERDSYQLHFSYTSEERIDANLFISIVLLFPPPLRSKGPMSHDDFKRRTRFGDLLEAVEKVAGRVIQLVLAAAREALAHAAVAPQLAHDVDEVRRQVGVAVHSDAGAHQFEQPCAVHLRHATAKLNVHAWHSTNTVSDTNSGVDWNESE